MTLSQDSFSLVPIMKKITKAKNKAFNKEVCAVLNKLAEPKDEEFYLTWEVATRFGSFMFTLFNSESLYYNVYGRFTTEAGMTLVKSHWKGFEGFRDTPNLYSGKWNILSDAHEGAVDQLKRRIEFLEVKES